MLIRKLWYFEYVVKSNIWLPNLVLQTARFAERFNVCLSIVNDIIKFVAEYQGVSVCPPLMNPVKHDFSENDKVHHSPAGAHRLFALRNQLNKHILYLLIEDPTIRGRYSPCLYLTFSIPCKKIDSAPTPLEMMIFFNEHYTKTPSRKQMHIIARKVDRPIQVNHNEY